MTIERTSGPPPNRGFWIFMACCALGAVTMIALLIGGEVEGARVGPNIQHQSK